jgi:hypothetical protein
MVFNWQGSVFVLYCSFWFLCVLRDIQVWLYPFFNVGARWEWFASPMPLAFSPLGKSTVTHCTRGSFYLHLQSDCRNVCFIMSLHIFVWSSAPSTRQICVEIDSAFLSLELPNTFKFLFKSDKMRYFTWGPTYIYDHLF